MMPAFRIALDDFGTGFASLTHLKQFAVHEIKIDQSFVRDLENDPDDAAIVDAVTGLGRALGLDVTAEGVETQAQADFLTRRGCEMAQGYLYSKPVSAARATVLLRRQALARKRFPPRAHHLEYRLCRRLKRLAPESAVVDRTSPYLMRLNS